MDQQEYNQMISDLKELVAQGDVESMRYLGDLYHQGPSGTDENIFAALPYWKMAADHGESDLAVKVGIALMSGNGCEKDEMQGYKYLKQGADGGIAMGQYLVGLCLLDGTGTGVDRMAGEEYLRAAACNNHPQAQINLARTLMEEDGGFQEAMHWICCAHLNGVEEATNALNIVMQDPENVPVARAELAYIQAHGVIPRKRPSAPQSDGGGCYIATAVYGSYDAPEVLTLRAFRDQVLQKHWLGMCFIKAYYFLSPPIARRLKDARRINGLVRAVLDRFVARLSEG